MRFPITLLIASTILLPISGALAHGGGLDARGCHTESSTGEYHCHKGSLEGQSFPSKEAAAQDRTQSRSTSSTSSSGYDRDHYGDWIDADRDCQDTRQEILIDHGTNIELNSSGCRVVSGRWEGPYTGENFTDPGDLHIDHVVPLKEAHISGAADWPSRQKRRFANDPDNLLPVEAGANMSKGAQGPSEWMPETKRCAYLEQWIAVKEKWELDMDRRERRYIESAGCQ